MARSAETTAGTAAVTPAHTTRGKVVRGGVITAREIELATSKARTDRKDIWLTDPGVRRTGCTEW